MPAPCAKGTVMGNEDILLTAAVVWSVLLPPQKYRKMRHLYLIEK